jgi:hypothetical protein
VPRRSKRKSFDLFDRLCKAAVEHRFTIADSVSHPRGKYDFDIWLYLGGDGLIGSITANSNESLKMVENVLNSTNLQWDRL